MSNMKKIILNNGFQAIEILPAEVLTFAIIWLTIVIALYLFRSIGLFTLAKRQNLKCAWLSFIPFAWIYVPAKIMGTIIIGRKPYKNFATFATIIFVLNEVIALTITVLANFPLVGYYLQGGEVYLASYETYNQSLKAMGFSPYIFSDNTVFVKGIIYPYSNQMVIGTILAIMSLVSNVLSIVSIFVTVLVYIGLFRKFWPERYVLATVLSVLGLFPIMAFVIRKKKAINFNEYMRSRYYGHRYNPYGGVNPNAGGYGASQTGQNTTKEPDCPFEEFEQEKGGDDPFDFNEK